MPLFSVVIATYNRAQLVCAAVDSVLSQRFRDFELIVVDDGSTDETRQMLKAYGDRIRYFRQTNQGPCRARNLGISEALGEYVCILDSDDVFLPWTLDVYQQVVEQYSRPTLIRGAMTKFERDAEIHGIAEESLNAEHWQDYLQSAAALYQVAIPGAIRREALVSVGGFAENNICAEEHDLYLRLGLEKGFVMVHTPQVYAYRQHAETQSRDTGPLYRGARMLLKRENAGVYPGGKTRQPERALFLARSLQYSIRRCFELGAPALATELYLRALPQYIRSGQRDRAWRDGRVAARRLRASLRARWR